MSHISHPPLSDVVAGCVEVAQEWHQEQWVASQSFLITAEERLVWATPCPELAEGRQVQAWPQMVATELCDWCTMSPGPFWLGQVLGVLLAWSAPSRSSPEHLSWPPSGPSVQAPHRAEIQVLLTLLFKSVLSFHYDFFDGKFKTCTVWNIQFQIYIINLCLTRKEWYSQRTLSQRGEWGDQERCHWG